MLRPRSLRLPLLLTLFFCALWCLQGGRLVQVSDELMLPNLSLGDLLWVHEDQTAKPGEIVLIQGPDGTLLLRRLIALPTALLTRAGATWSVNGRQLRQRRLAQIPDPEARKLSWGEAHPLQRELFLESIDHRFGYAVLEGSPFHRLTYERWSASVPADQSFVLCDNRPRCREERWQRREEELSLPGDEPAAPKREQEGDETTPRLDRWLPRWRVIGVVRARLWPLSPPSLLRPFLP